MSDEERVSVVKAISIGGTVQQQASIGGGDDRTALAFAQLGALVPPYDPLMLCGVFEQSGSMRSGVDAYATNIDGFGHSFNSVIDFDSENLREQVEQIILAEREVRLNESTDIDDAEVQARIVEFQREAKRERARLTDFFDFCCFDYSFVQLRKRTRQDLEVTGNAYWEVLRDGRGDIAKFVYVPSYTMRMMPLDQEVTLVPEQVRVGSVSVDTVQTRRRMRRFVQIVNGYVATHFKALGDPRAISRRTGRAYATVEELMAVESNAELATEIVHFLIPSPSSPYGVPRWIGTLISVLGSRSMDEVNYLYFENKSVPPLALIVSGGRLSEESVPRIERFIEENLKGKQNFHKILVLEADQSGTGTAAKIELKSLIDAQQKDELFQKYDERNIDKLGASFRLPPLLRGDGRDFNRAVADAQLRFAEDQVFQPERDEFDFLMNRKILLAMGVRFWKFQSRTTVTRDPERLTAIVERLMRAGALTPGEGRECAGDILNKNLKNIRDDWTRRPITLTLAGIQTGVEDINGGRAAAPQSPEGLGAAAKQLAALRDQLETEAGDMAERRMKIAREFGSQDETEVVKVPRAEFEKWFEGGEAR